ncbi:tetratricopeptide repeat protein [Streptomyces sp. MST-110588]|nr:tetratricopeptide repeat protein [Streptomyces sp. MST-110588]
MSGSASGPGRARRPNTAFRQLRGRLSPGEFAAAVRRAARDIGEQVSCDARYVGRVEAGEIRCPNYAYERVFRHMFPGLTLADLGFAPRETVRGRKARTHAVAGTDGGGGAGDTAPPEPGPGTAAPIDPRDSFPQNGKESDVLRRAFITGGSAVTLGLAPLPSLLPTASAASTTFAPFDPYTSSAPSTRRMPLSGTRSGIRGGAHGESTPAGEAEAAAVEEAVRRIRLLDDRHGAEGIYRNAARPLRAAYALLDSGTHHRSVTDRLQAGAGELAISVGWLAHDSGRFEDARSHYAEALATARVAGDPALEAHAFCNTAFLARDADRPREAVRTAQAAQHAAERLGSSRLLSLLALREAGGRAGLGDRTGCAQALARAHRLFEHGPSDADPEWMSFFGAAELEGLEAQCWAALGDRGRAAEHARRAVALQDPHFTRNIALFTAELADNLAHSGEPEEAAAAGSRVISLLEVVQSARIRTMLDATARTLRPHRGLDEVTDFLDRYASVRRSA